MRFSGLMVDGKKNKNISAITNLNKELSRVKIQADKGGNLSLRGQFPDGMGDTKRKRLSLRCKNTPEGRKIALGKAKEIESQLILGTWEQEQKNKLTFYRAVQEYEKHYWSTTEKTKNRAYNWKKNQYAYWGKLPQDKIFNTSFLKEILSSLEGGSYQQRKMATLLSPVARYHGVQFDFAPYKKYQQQKDLKKLPTEEVIFSSFGTLRYEYHNVAIVLLAYFGIRPHELFRSFLLFEDDLVKIEVGKDSKKKKFRTSYPIPIQGTIEPLLELKLKQGELYDLQEYYRRFINVDNANTQVGAKVSHWFKKLPYTPYQLRHCYAVRGSLNNVHPNILCKWMGHAIEVHYKHYGSMIDNTYSDKFWKESFST